MGFFRRFQDQALALLEHPARCVDDLGVTDALCLCDHSLQIGCPAAEAREALLFPIFHGACAVTLRGTIRHWYLRSGASSSGLEEGMSEWVDSGPADLGSIQRGWPLI